MKNVITTRFRTAIVMLAVLCVAGCSTGYQNDYVDPDFQNQSRRTVAVLPFQNLAGYPRAGDIVHDLLITELMNYDRFDLLSSSRVNKVVEKMGFERDQLDNSSSLKRIAEKLNTDYLIVGSVTEYRYKKGLGEEPVVGINVRLMNAETEQLLWSSSHSAGGEYFWFSHDSLNRLAQEVIGNMVQRLPR